MAENIIDKFAKVNVLRHSLAHILAYAVRELYKDVSFGYGPAVENGFYYDFKLPSNLEESDLLLIQEKMNEIISKKLEFSQKEVPIAKAKKLFAQQSFKLETIDALASDKSIQTVSVYSVGDFIDLCVGPHVKNTKEIKAGSFRLLRVSGAYWKGDADNEMLQRIFGIAFETKQELETYEQKLSEISKRDHRVLGKELDLFSLDRDIGLGLPLFHPKGAIVRFLLQNFSQQAHMMN
ncbi:MAG: hypothetical protein LBG15_10925 [Dysgonamonadaceae bacterium]|jgi:threonyl-tRNA synthetase|nr:hypothetical protein [Dysgonamonadaceae bacterium]